MMDKKCFNCKGSRCMALTVKKCPENCSSRITDPMEYLERLHDMLTYNSKNANSVAELNAEILEIRTKYGLWKDVDYYRKDKGSMAGLSEAYWEDTHRGDRGGQSEGNANPAGAKQKMKDNRPQECKLNRAEKQAIYDATKEWEAENGKLDKLSRSPLTRTKVDSYTGDPIDESRVNSKKKKK